MCASSRVPADVQTEPGWRAFMLRGPIPFSQTGVLAALVAPLATAAIPVFAISTFDTDYVLVQETRLDEATAALHAAGYEIA